MPTHAPLNRAIQVAMEPLDARTLLSVALNGNALTIIGSESDDEIRLAANRTFINILDLRVNGEVQYFSLSAIKTIDLQLLGGNDTVLVNSSLKHVPYRIKIDGGPGNDTISSGSGRDTLIGSDGDDLILGND